MKRILIILLGLFSVAYGQFSPTSARTNFKLGVALGTRDSTGYGASDSLVVVINRQGRMMYRSTDGYWKILSNAAASDYVPYTGAVASVNIGEFRLSSRSVATDSILARSSAGGRIVSNSGTVISEYGAGGGSNMDFHGFAGYNANRSSTYTARSFTDKGYVDSLGALKANALSGTLNALPFFNTTSTLGSSSVSQVSGAGISIQGTALTDGGQLGSELLSGSGWTSTDWTGSFGAGFTHTTGNTTALSNSLAAVVDSFYQITYTVTGRTAGTFTISFGGYTSGALSASGAVGPQATTTGNLVITPTSTFDGTIGMSIRTISFRGASLTFVNSSNVVVNEVRSFSNATNGGFGAGVLRRNTTGSGNLAGGLNSQIKTTSGINNTSWGALSLDENTIGSSNSAFGNGALGRSISGSSNSAFAAGALRLNITGNNNTAGGTSSLDSNLTGNQNSSWGVNSLRLNVSGSNLSALGFEAGSLTNSGASNRTSSNSLYLGANSRSSADGNINEIVVGQDGRGNGSNTTTIGNASTTATHLFGRLLVNGAVNDGVSGLRVTGRGLFSLGAKFGAAVEVVNNSEFASFRLKNIIDSLRWGIGNTDTEAGSNTGSNFAIFRYTDAGAFIDRPLVINRANGSASFINSVTAQRGNFTSLVLNKDSVPLSTTNIMSMTLDTATGRVQRAQVSGSYTPTITGITNVDASTTNVCFWSRAGRMVTVTGYLEVDPTLGITATEFRITLPIATSFTGGNSGKVAGTMVGLDGAASGSILADIAGNRASFRYTTPASAANMGLSFTFSYLLE